MQKVWKIGTRWGDKGPSNLDLFLSYQCAFFGLDGQNYGDWRAAKEGDLLLVCSGSIPVAIGMIKTPFQNYRDADIQFCLRDETDWIGDDDVVICKAQYQMIPQNDVENIHWSNDSRRRFCEHSTREIVIDKWNEYLSKNIQGQFEITSRTVGLASEMREAGVFSPRVKYRIPVYQRPYSWSEPELRRLMEDLRDAVAHSEPAFMGTMQLSAPVPLGKDGEVKSWAYDIIDGQQRTTTFMVLRCILEERLGIFSNDARDSAYITHVNRGVAQKDLDEFWQVRQNKRLSSYTPAQDNHNPYLANTAIINNLLDEYFGEQNNDDKEESGGSGTVKLEELYNFILSNLRFVIIETKAGLSKTLKIFNTINTTGLDLGSEDLFKIRLYEYRKDICGDTDDVFDEISKVYERIENHKREDVGGIYYSMSTVLEIYHRVLIARHKLSNQLGWYTTPRFFDCVFDTLLNIRPCQDIGSNVIELKISDLNDIIDCLNELSAQYSQNESMKIMHHFIGSTRYESKAWFYSVIALYFNAITPQELLQYDTMLFKLLVPPSLKWSKTVYAVQNSLLGILKSLPDSVGKGLDALNQRLQTGLDNINSKDEFLQACEYEIAGNWKWKTLICRLCEYLTTIDAGKEPSFSKLFQSSIDIEHIQSYTDSKDCEAVWNEWGSEINRLGNLVMFETSLNRSVSNDAAKKPDAYRQSKFISVNKLSPQVALWTLESAIKRRQELTLRMEKYLFSLC